MTQIYYSAAWTDSGFLFGCSHEHGSIVEAASCIPCAGGYVVGIENGAIRALTAQEEVEFQYAVSGHYADNPAVGTAPTAPAEAAVSDPGYALMVRIRVVDHWTWTTWMRFGTYAEAAAHAGEGNKVVRFRSPEWTALRHYREPASPIVTKAPRKTAPQQGEGETLLEFALRFLSAYGFPQHSEPISDVTNSLLNDEMDLSLSRPGEPEIRELERMYAKDRYALLEALGNRSLTFREPKSGCR